MQSTMTNENTMTADTSTPTTARKPKSADKIKWELEHQIEFVKERYEKVQAAFLASVQQDPTYAISRQADDMVKMQAEHEVWLKIERELADNEPAAVLTKNLAECRSAVQSYFGTSCTCPIFNAVARAKAGALVRQIDQIDAMMKCFGM